MLSWIEKFSLRRAKSNMPPARPMTDLSSAAPREHFFEAARLLPSTARVLEAGTKQAIDGRSTHSHSWFPNVARANYIMADVASGQDVDIIADLHALPKEWEQSFDAFVATAVFEHLERPWIAAKEIFRILAPGGLCYIATHQTYPLHGFPADFFRFSKEALALLLTDAGFTVIDVAYEHRAQIIAPPALIPQAFSNKWNEDWPSYLCVHILAKK